MTNDSRLPVDAARLLKEEAASKFADLRGIEHDGVEWVNRTAATLAAWHSIDDALTLSEQARETLQRERDEARQELADWKICTLCGEQMTAPGYCSNGTAEEVKGYQSMYQQMLEAKDAADQARVVAEQERDDLKKELARMDSRGESINPRTASESDAVAACLKEHMSEACINSGCRDWNE